MAMRDRDVRQALKQKVLATHLRAPETLVIEELGIKFGTARVDVAVVNGLLHGYEIKSDSDNLARLPAQVAAYGSVFDRMTIIVGERYVTPVQGMVPEWWGVKLAVPGPRRAVHFADVRRSRQNLSVDSFALASFLWRDEALALLKKYGFTRITNKTRGELCMLLSASVELAVLKAEVRGILKLREGWRSGAPSTPCADC